MLGTSLRKRSAAYAGGSALKTNAPVWARLNSLLTQIGMARTVYSCITVQGTSSGRPQLSTACWRIPSNQTPGPA